MASRQAQEPGVFQGQPKSSEVAENDKGEGDCRISIAPPFATDLDTITHRTISGDILLVSERSQFKQSLGKGDLGYCGTLSSGRAQAVRLSAALVYRCALIATGENMHSRNISKPIFER